APDGSKVGCGTSDGRVKIWDILTPHNHRTFKGHNGSVDSVDFCADGLAVISGADDGSIIIWDLETGQHKNKFENHIEQGSNIFSAGWSPNGNKVASGSNDKTVKIWSIFSESSEYEMPMALEGHDAWLQLVRYFPSGLRLLSVSIDYTVVIWDTNLGVMMYSFNSHVMWVTAVTVSSDSSRIAYGSNDNTGQIWNSSKSFREHVLAKHTDCIEAVIFSPD
ncbi:WD40-repeat-containing domain protein, partial [Rhodocollybia butyracea]